MICNLGVVGSNPTRGSKEKKEFFMGKYQSGQMGQTVNLLAYAFGGSNPSLPTKKVPVGVARFPVVPACGHRGGRGLTLIRYIFAEVAQLIEHQPSKLRVASLSLVFRSNFCLCSSGVEHFLGKEEVAGSNPAIGSTISRHRLPG